MGSLFIIGSEYSVQISKETQGLVKAKNRQIPNSI